MLRRRASLLAAVIVRPTAPPPLASRTLARHLRATPPKEIAPLLAGVGIAVAAYGTKLLIDAAQSGRVQQAVRDVADAASAAGKAASAAASGAAASASNRRRSREAAAASAAEASEERHSNVDAYFTTDVMGVDLGSGAKAWSGACAAIVESGAPRVVENEQGMRATPSVVAFTDGGEVLVGQPAKKLLFARSATPVTAFSQLLGVAHDSAELAELRDAGVLGSLDVVAAGGGSGGAAIRVHGVTHRPEELSARVLSTLKTSAESALGNRVVLSAVVCAPVLANDATRDAIVAAGKRAGLRRVDLIEAPVAGACAAALEVEELANVRTLGVYELGGRGFSFSVLERDGSSGSGGDGDGDGSGAGWAVRSAERRPLLGSELFDGAVVDWLVSSFLDEHGLDLGKDHLALQRLHEAAEASKLELCSAPQASISLPFITADADGPKHLDASLTRAKLDELIEPILRESLPAVDAAVGGANLDGVLLVGGAARLASVVDVVGEHLRGVPVYRTSRPEEAVALGAAAHAAQLQALEYAQA